MSDLPRVFTIVLNWNGLEDTRECLESLRRADYPDNHVIVIDNGSDADEASVLERELAGFIEMVRNPVNLGFAGGMNVGIRRALEAGAEYVLLLNNDVTVEPGFLSAMVKTARHWPDVAAACPTIYFHDDPDRIYSTGGWVVLWFGLASQAWRGKVVPYFFEDPPDAAEMAELLQRRIESPGQTPRLSPLLKLRPATGKGRRVSVSAPLLVVSRDYADGACMLMSREAIERVGLLDESYFMYWEETDWCFRARKSGLLCYWVPEAKVWHKAARARASDDDFHYLYERNALLFVRKRGNPLQVVTALLTHLLVYGPWYVVRRPGRIGRAVAEWRAVLWNVGLRGSGRNRQGQRPLV